jgi:imidazolonepropionase-like amidohydrolase
MSARTGWIILLIAVVLGGIVPASWAGTAAGDPEPWHAARPDRSAVVFVRGATVWTSGPQGILENADLLVRDGKVVRVGRGLTPPQGSVVVEGAGKHVTPGLIDCHSHSYIVGDVNEGTNNVTAEVRIQDVVNSESINIYRQLAGGLTSANLLHGSANAIGGQNCVVKLRNGEDPESLKLEGAKPGIKFALGENPKQSNWGEKYTSRYPQTRSGVEQLIRERFLAARDYEQARRDWKRGRQKGLPPKPDLQLDALVEILRGDRLVHSHSYRADEILMLIRLAEEQGFRIGSFQHVLEGYKVADEIAKHGAGASSFSDWWAYKFEVYDAIPYSGAILWDRDVVVSYNSDSDELARRLNLEAAKAVKYGGVPEDEALKFVTLNPAKQLGVDGRVGSLEPGKDADFVVWSGHPLSTYSVCEQTWVDGRKYFDRAEDLAGREAILAERQALIQKVKEAKKKGVQSPEKQKTEETASGYRPPEYLDERSGHGDCHHAHDGGGR